jgi:hypothetical protein
VKASIVTAVKILSFFLEIETAAFEQTDAERLADEFPGERNTRRTGSNNAYVGLEDLVRRNGASVD